MTIASNELNDLVFITIIATSIVWILVDFLAKFFNDLFEERRMKREMEKLEFYEGYQNFVEIMSEPIEEVTP